MKKQTNDLINQCTKLRSGALSLTELQSWINTNASLLKNISTGNLLKLKRGDIHAAMSVIASLVPPCEICQQLPATQDFKNRQDHSQQLRLIDSLFIDQVIQRIQHPCWITNNAHAYGAYAFYKCTRCNSLWLLIEPECQDNGRWERLA